MILRQGYFRDVPFERELYDYGVRTDGQPVYLGHAPLNTEITGSWVIFFFKYDGSGFLTEKYSLEGVWNDRAALFAAYA